MRVEDNGDLSLHRCDLFVPDRAEEILDRGPVISDFLHEATVTIHYAVQCHAKINLVIPGRPRAPLIIGPLPCPACAAGLKAVPMVQVQEVGPDGLPTGRYCMIRESLIRKFRGRS
jgi:hypothetical protein